MNSYQATKNPEIPCDKCVGCTACAQSCPADCISMQADEEGFFYPKLNPEACLHCHLCERVCPVHQADSLPYDVTLKSSQAFALICKDKNLHTSVGSGGAFSLMARQILAQGGVVIGAAWTQDWLVEHVAVETWEEYQRLCSTKYLQSNMGNILKQTRDFFKTGRQVLFGGTGCQIAGLTSFLRKEYPNLTTVNIACYGAPSPGVWSHYLRDLQRKYQLGRINSIHFRKKEGNSSMNMVVKGDLATYKNYVYSDPFGWGLVKDVINRPSCENCLFKGAASHSDITIGDARGIEKYDPHADHLSGISVVVSHSPKGAALIAAIKSDCDYFRILPLPGAISQNMGIICATNSHTKLRNSFFTRFLRGESPHQILVRLQRGSLPGRVLRAFRTGKGKLKQLIKKLIR